MVDEPRLVKPHPPHQEGSREHVISWTNLGRRCSMPNCEINHGGSVTAPSEPDRVDRLIKEFSDDLQQVISAPSVAESFLPFLRHRVFCVLQAVRDNPPDDAECTCGLREVWESVQ